MSDSLKKQKKNGFHPMVKACAYFGAFFSIFAAIASLTALVGTTTFWGAIVVLGRASLCMLLAWFFWYAGKYSANPFKAHLFSK